MAIPRLFLIVSALVASSTFFTLGYDAATNKFLFPMLIGELELSTLKVELLGGLPEVSSIMGAILSGYLSDAIGRRYTIAIAGLFQMIGSLFTCLAVDFGMLVTGRCFLGLGVGIGMHVGPIYVAEIAPPSLRGFLAILPEVLHNVGFLMGFIIPIRFAHMVGHRLVWRFLLGFATAPSFTLILMAFLVLLESPSWYFVRGRLPDAQRVCHRFAINESEGERTYFLFRNGARIPVWHGTTNIPAMGHLLGGELMWKDLLLLVSRTRKALLSIICLNFLHHSINFGIIQPHLVWVLRHASSGRIRSIGYMTIAKLGLVLWPAFGPRRIRRRFLSLFSIGTSIIASFLLGSLLLHNTYSEKEIGVWSSLFFLAVAYSSGLGPISWAYPNEVLPYKLRSQGSTIAVMVSVATTAAWDFLMMTMESYLRLGGSCLVIAGITSVGFIVAYFTLEETGSHIPEQTVEGDHVSTGAVASSLNLSESFASSQNLSESFGSITSIQATAA